MPTKTDDRLWTGIRRDKDQGVIVQVKSKSAQNEPGVTIVNPDSALEDRICRKVFERKPVFLPDEYDQAMDKHIRGPNTIVISMNGYSSLKPEWLRKYQIEEGAYETACAALLRCTIDHLIRKFRAIRVRVIHGASDMGIDGVVDQVAKEKFDYMPLGFSCPEFMMYVRDDNTPVYVAENKAKYADAFIRSLDLLITTGGRMHALEHDTLASCVYDKRLHFVDVPGMLSPIGVPARIVNADGSITIENAAAAFGRNISFSDSKKITQRAPIDGDEWDGLFLEMGGIATEVARRILSPRHMFNTFES